MTINIILAIAAIYLVCRFWSAPAMKITVGICLVLVAVLVALFIRGPDTPCVGANLNASCYALLNESTGKVR